MGNNDNAPTYTIKHNLLLPSTKAMSIYDDDYNIIGYVERFYRNLGEKILAYLSGRPIFHNFQTQDINGNIRSVVKQSILFSKRAEWTVQVYSAPKKDMSFVLRDTSLISTAKTFAFDFEGQQFTIENNYAHFQTKFLNSSRDVIAQCSRKDIENINIQIFKPELDIYQFATLGLIQWYWRM